MNSLILSFCSYFLIGATEPVETLRAYETKVIDFGIFYPIPKLKAGAERRQMGSAGVTYNYQFYFHPNLGLNLNPSAWFFPIRIDGNKASLYALALETGLSARLMPGSFMDPTFYALGGIGGNNAGKTVKGKIVYPVTGGIGFNLWRETDRFKDRSLALHAFGQAKYYINSVEVMEPLFFDFGLAFRGSF